MRREGSASSPPEAFGVSYVFTIIEHFCTFSVGIESSIPFSLKLFMSSRRFYAGHLFLCGHRLLRGERWNTIANTIRRDSGMIKIADFSAKVLCSVSLHTSFCGGVTSVTGHAYLDIQRPGASIALDTIN